jgi:alcohol dehydrogenase (cytochrome c)
MHSEEVKGLLSLTVLCRFTAASTVALCLSLPVLAQQASPPSGRAGLDQPPPAQGGQTPLAQQDGQAPSQGPTAPSGPQRQNLAAVLENYKLVTAEQLRNPADGDWPMYRRTYDGWGYSPLARINASNVKRLVPVWSFATSTMEGHQAPPIIANGVMFVSTPGNHVLALDARTGDLLWRHERPVPEDMAIVHPTNRGVAVLGDKVYFAALEAVLVALDARTGKKVWEAPVENYASGYYMTLAPLVADGKVMVGVSGGEFGIRGFVAAFDAETGKHAWTTYTVPAPGEPGSETWPRGDQWRTGGGSVWITGVYDPETNLSFWGTGNGGPWMGDQRPGDNLYTSSVIAVDVATGRIKGYHQYHWNDSWDWDEVASPVIVDFEKGGRVVKGLAHAGRDGYLWMLERTADRINFVEAKPYVRQNVFTSIDPKTGRPTYDEANKPGTGKKATFCPSMYGGKDWPPVAYSPRTKLLYIPANENLCSTVEGQPVYYTPGDLFTGVASALRIVRGADHIGELQAWDLSKGERVWTYKFEKSQNWGPVLATGGDLVFMGGTNDRYFRAFDARTGDVLWEYRLSSGIVGVPVAYEIDGKQYVAVQSGWGVDAQRMQQQLAQAIGYNLDVPQGGTVWVFAIPE